MPVQAGINFSDKTEIPTCGFAAITPGAKVNARKERQTD